jgi:hypothetical protein
MSPSDMVLSFFALAVRGSGTTQRRVAVCSPRLYRDCGLLEFCLQYTRRARAREHAGTVGGELQLASDKTGDDAALIGNILLAKPHDVRRTGRLVFL